MWNIFQTRDALENTWHQTTQYPISKGKAIKTTTWCNLYIQPRFQVLKLRDISLVWIYEFGCYPVHIVWVTGVRYLCMYDYVCIYIYIICIELHMKRMSHSIYDAPNQFH